MDNVEVYERKNRLDRLFGEVEESLTGAPEGFLHVSESHGRVQYQQRMGRHGKTRYLNRSNEELVRRLAQKKYDEAVMRVVRDCKAKTERLIGQLERAGVLSGADGVSGDPGALGGVNGVFGGVWSDGEGARGLRVATKDGYRPLREPSVRIREVEDVFARMPKVIRGLIVPYEVDDEVFVGRWESEIQRGISFLAEECKHKTEQGERVRSKSEVIIADKLHRAGIPYRYEPRVILRSSETVRPDFLVLNTRTRQEVIWEHFGMMGEERYRKHAWEKMATYMASGVMPGRGLVATFESKDAPLVTEMVDEVIEYFLR